MAWVGKRYAAVIAALALVLCPAAATAADGQAESDQAATGMLIEADGNPPPLIPVEHFARLPLAKSLELSPDGDYLAYLTPIEGRYHLVIRKTIPAAGDKPLLIPMGEEEELEWNWLTWANDERLILSIRFPAERFGVPTMETRLIAVDRDGSDIQPLNSGANRGDEYEIVQVQDNVIDFLRDDPEHILIKQYRPDDRRPMVYRLNVYSGRTDRAERSRHRMIGWETDRAGRVRYGYSNDDDELREYYRLPGGDEWYEFPDADPGTGIEFSYDRFTADPTVVYVKTYDEAGRARLATFDLTTRRLSEETLFSHPKVDVDRPVMAMQDDRLIGFGYTEHQYRIDIVDDAARAEQSWIDSKLPDTVNHITQRRYDHRYALVYANAADRPPRYFLLDRAEKRLIPLAEVYPELNTDHLAPTHPLTIEARDGLPLQAYLTLPKGKPAQDLPLVMMPHGGPAARDTMDFDYWVQFLANRGYAVLQVNFRGSEGYGRNFLLAGHGEWGLKMQDDVTDTVRWAIDQRIADPQRICIVGASYGGYAALMGAVKTPDLYRCAAGINGVYDLIHVVNDRQDYRQADFTIRSLGLEVDRRRQLKETSPRRRGDEIEAAVLLLHGENDRVVPEKQSKRMARQLRKSGRLHKYIELPADDHYLSRGDSRLIMLRQLEAFLAAHLGGRQG